MSDLFAIVPAVAQPVQGPTQSRSGLAIQRYRGRKAPRLSHAKRSATESFAGGADTINSRMVAPRRIGTVLNYAKPDADADRPVVHGQKLPSLRDSSWREGRVEVRSNPEVAGRNDTWNFSR